MGCHEGCSIGVFLLRPAVGRESDERDILMWVMARFVGKWREKTQVNFYLVVVITGVHTCVLVCSWRGVGCWDVCLTETERDGGGGGWRSFF